MMLKQLILVAALGVASCGANANSLTVEFELPNFDTADYHKPYVAIWAESKRQNHTFLLWHLTKRKEDKWLVDIRRWWRKQGRYGGTPDGVTGATKGPGKYSETFDVGDLSQFNLFIEVVREDGGRSLLKQPIDFSDNHTYYQLAADEEISAVKITKGSS